MLHCWRPTVSILHLYPLLILEIDFSVVAIFPSRARHRVRHRHRLPPAAPRFDRICRRSVSYRSGHPSARPRSKNELRNSTSISRSMRTRRANKALYVQPTLAFSPTAHCRASGWSIKKPPALNGQALQHRDPVCRPTPGRSAWHFGGWFSCSKGEESAVFEWFAARGDESVPRGFIFRIANKTRFANIGKWVWVAVFLTI